MDQSVNPSTRQQQADLPHWRAAGWGVGQIAVQIFRDTPSLLLLFYMTQVLAIPPGVAGSAIFLPKLVVAVVCDYGAGWLSDRLRRYRLRGELLLVGAVIGPVLLIWLFQPPSMANVDDRAVHVALVLSVYMALFSLFSVPHLSIGTQLSSVASTRTALMGWRTAFSAVGLLIASSLGPILVSVKGGGPEGYVFMSWVLAAIVCASLLVSYAAARKPERAHDVASVSQQSSGNWQALWNNRGAKVLMLAFTLQLCAMGMAYATLAYLFTFNLAFPDPLRVLGVMVLITSIFAVCVQPMWVAVSNRLSKRIVFIIGSTGYAAALMVQAFAPPQSELVVYVGGAMMGIFQSACFMTAFAMLSDVIDVDAKATGVSRAGFYSSLFTVIDKVGFALGGTLLIGVLLQATGFVAGAPEQTAGALRGIAAGFAVVPLGFIAASIALMALAWPQERRAAAVA